MESNLSWDKKLIWETLSGFSFLFVVLLTLYFIVNLVQFGLRLARGHRIANTSTPFGVKNTHAKREVLIVGDSTGVGTGADNAFKSIAGLILQDYPCVEIRNNSSNGAMVKDVIAQLDLINKQDFDLVLVQVGTNDILRFTPLHELVLSTENLLIKARSKGKHVIFMSAGNVGNAPAFFPPVNWVYTYRTLLVRNIFHKVSDKLGVQHVDLFKPRNEDPFLEDKSRYFAPDFFHPSAEGYRLWYSEIKKQTLLDLILGCIEENIPSQGYH
jgi:lysophospholipase L1-like esterase